MKGTVLPTNLSIDQSNLTPDCLDHLRRILWTESIELTDAQQINLDGQELKIYRGHGSLLDTACQIEAWSLVEKDQSLLLVCAKPDRSPSFGQCFPMMPIGETLPGYITLENPDSSTSAIASPGFYLSQISLQKPLWVFLYSSLLNESTRSPTTSEPGILQNQFNRLEKHVKDTWWSEWSVLAGIMFQTLVKETKNGLYMWGRMPVVPELKDFTDFLEWTDFSETIFKATILYPDTFPVLSLQVALTSKEVKFASFKLTQPQVELDSPLYYSPDTSHVILRAGLGLQLEDKEREIECEVDFPLTDDLILATGTYTGETIPFVDASAIADLPDLQPKDRSEFELTLQFSKSNQKLEQVGFAVILENWPLIEDLLTLESIAFSFDIYDPLGSKMVTASIAACASLGKHNQIELFCSGHYPSGQLFFRLASSTQLTIGNLIGEFGGRGDGIQDDLTISYLTAEYNLYSKHFSTSVDVTGIWKILDGFVLKSLRFQLQRLPTLYVEIGALISIAGVVVRLEANYDEGWQFEGYTSTGQEIPIVKLIEDLGEIFGAPRPELPTSLEELAIKDLSISFNTKSKDFKFTCAASSESLTCSLIIDVKHEDGNYQKELGGNFDVKLDGQSLRFSFKYKQEQNEKEKKKIQAFIATYTGELPLSISALVDKLAPDDGGLTLIVKHLDVAIDLKSVVFTCFNESSTEQGANGKSPEPTKFLFGLALNVSASLDLSGLPVGGEELASIGVEDLQLLIASQPFASQDVTTINGLLPEGVTKLPVAAMPAEDITPPPALATGINLSALLKLGEGESIPLILSPSSSESPASVETQRTTATDPSTTQAVTPSVKWIKIQKSFGPVRFDRLGLQFQNQVIWFLLDASLSAAGLTISLEGLGFGSRITKFEPRFELQGLGINFKNDPVEISGAFLKTGDYRYSGQALIKARSFMLSAIGAYESEVGKDPSLFVFAYLDTPLGGPPCFYVTGLAAGFGYNSTVRIPAIEEVKDFPLLAAMVDPSKIGIQKNKPANPMAVLESLHKWIKPQPGTYWLAAGISFRSFEIIKSNVLAIAEFGKEFQVLVVGFSTLQLPQEGDRIYAYAELMIQITVKPTQGFVAAMARLTPNSYLLDPACHLTGGFAFYVWFGKNKHAGDFVLTIGGYHPKFIVPDHYPQVPRMGFNWPVSSTVTIKGEAYFALTPSCVMAGGKLEVLYHSGNLQAWFIAQADMLVYWKPFYFKASTQVRIGVSYRVKIWFIQKTLRVELGASVELWGPPTGGRVHIDWWVISFTVSFGAGKRTSLKAVDWDGFKTMLPQIKNGKKDALSAGAVGRAGDIREPTDADLAVIQISVNNGLLQQVDEQNGKKRWIVRPDEFTFSIETAVPATETRLNNQNPVTTQDMQEIPTIGIRPMGIRSITSPLTISICKSDQPDPLPISEWDYDSHTRKMPEAMWGQPVNGNLQPGSKLIENCRVGLQNIRHKPHAIPSVPSKFGVEEAFTYFRISLEDGSNPVLPLSPADTEPTTGFPTTNHTLKTIQDTLMAGEVKQRRTAVFQALAELGVNAFTDGDLNILAANPTANYDAAPMIGSLVPGQ